MELDFGTLLIGGLALLICILPFALDYRSRKKKENNILQLFKKIVQEQNCQISEYEVCNNFVIGIDKIKNVVFLYNYKKEKPTNQFMELSSIQNCKVMTSHKTITHARGNYKAITKLELSFVSADPSKSERVWEFFNAEHSPQLNGEHQVIEKWCKLINKQLKK